MVLRDCPNESGECATEGCQKKKDHQWAPFNGDKESLEKICKRCYDASLRKAHKGTKRACLDAEAAPEEKSPGDTVLKILTIYQKR